MKLLKFPTTTEERINANIERLRKDLWLAESGEHVLQIMQLCEEYVMGLEDNVERDICLVNLQSSIICLSQYFY